MSALLKILTISLIVNFTCIGQNKACESLIPKDYVVYQNNYGDLNRNGLDDCIILVKKIDSTNIVMNRFDKKVDRNRRGIIIAFKTKDSVEIVDQNLTCFSSENEDGGVYYPPQLSLDIKRHKLYIKYEHGRYGSWTYTFRYQNSNFELIGFDTIIQRGPIVSEIISLNFLTKRKLTRKNLNKDLDVNDEQFKDTWSKIKINKPIRLSEIKDFDTLNMYQY